jgi:hypothetical protein
VLGFRKEWLAELEAQLIAYELPRTKVFLEPIDRRGVIEIVQGPAGSERLRERYGLTVEEGLAEIIADDLLADKDSAIAPTLQILLTKMWTSATAENYEHPEFSQDLYQRLRDIAPSLCRPPVELLHKLRNARFCLQSAISIAECSCANATSRNQNQRLWNLPRQLSRKQSTH